MADQIVQDYCNVIFHMCREVIKKDTTIEQIAKNTKEEFSKTREKIIKINNGLNVVADSDFARAIAKVVIETEKKILEGTENLKTTVSFLKELTDEVCAKGFIKSREKKKIDELLKRIKNSYEFALDGRLTLLVQSSDKEQFRSDFFDSFGVDVNEDTEEVQIFQKYQEFYKKCLQKMNKTFFIKIDSVICKFENKLQILGQELMAKVDNHLGNDIGVDKFQQQLNRWLCNAAESESLQANQNQVELMEDHYNWLKNILNKFSGMKVFTENLNISMHLAKFGSTVSGFATKTTDMDLTILPNCYINEVWLLKYLRQFILAEVKTSAAGKSLSKIQFIDSRIPSLKIIIKSDKETTQFDIIVNNILGVINSRFLSVYASLKWVKHFGILVKLWAKRNQLVSQDKFSSYFFNILAIHFLIETKRVNLILDANERNDKTPKIRYKRKTNKAEFEQFDVYFQFKTKKQDVSSITRINIFELLTQFFKYYSEDGKYWNYADEDRIISVDGKKDKASEPEKIFTVKDPFDQRHNPGRYGIGTEGCNKKIFLSKIYQAYKTMCEKNQREIKNLFGF